MKQVQRLIINKMIDGVLVVALENIPGENGTQVRIVPSATEPLKNPPKAEDFFCPGKLVRDWDTRVKLGKKSMKLVDAS